MIIHVLAFFLFFLNYKTRTEKLRKLNFQNFRKIRQHVRQDVPLLTIQRSTLTDYIPYEDMVQGLAKWREKTSTSPSGKHLGICKTIIKTLQNKYDNMHDNTNIEGIESLKKNKTTAALAMAIQQKIMNLAIKHCHTYQRWKTIHNFFLEKIPGRPLINKLRVIHIYEADWNLISKYFVLYKLHKTACFENTV
jgi:hypothetical protein